MIVAILAVIGGLTVGGFLLLLASFTAFYVREWWDQGRLERLERRRRRSKEN